ncbi:uncharacterized protein [Pyxicephalus adspersus]|uniref:uncharacterized protein isoform X2 n=1 Tax=Pyxicephalus adspersus TaxID=30357 RepID=UPI003B5C9B8B
MDSLVPFHSTLDVSAQKSRVLLLRKTSVRRRPGQRPVTFQEEPSAIPQLDVGVSAFPEQMPTLSPAEPPAPESSYPNEEHTETSSTSEPILRRKSSVRRRQRPATYQEGLAETSLPGITSIKMELPIFLGPSYTEPSQPIEESMDASSTSEQILINTPEEPQDEGTTSEPMLRRKSSIRRSRGKKPGTSEEQPIEPPPPAFTPLKMGVPLLPVVPTQVTPAPEPSIPTEQHGEEKSASEELAIKPKKGFMKHAG